MMRSCFPFKFGIGRLQQLQRILLRDLWKHHDPYREPLERLLPRALVFLSFRDKPRIKAYNEDQVKSRSDSPSFNMKAYIDANMFLRSI